MLNHFYPYNKVFFGLFHTYSRFAGPREAIFTALCRKNFGCSHFIVGRDHTGVGSFYSPTASQEIFHDFSDLGIEPIFFGDVVYSEIYGTYIESKTCNDKSMKHLSGSVAREMLKKEIIPPAWFMRPEIAEFTIQKLKSGEDVFI